MNTVNDEALSSKAPDIPSSAFRPVEQGPVPGGSAHLPPHGKVSCGDGLETDDLVFGNTHGVQGPVLW